MGPLWLLFLSVLGVSDPPRVPWLPLEAQIPAHPQPQITAPAPVRDTTAWTNVQLNTDGTTQIQNEEQVEIHPGNPLNAVAVWRDFRLGYRRVGIGVTHDGGLTWTDHLLEGSPYDWDSDPALTVGADGTYYLVVLSLMGLYDSNGLFLFTSSDEGQTWQGPIPIVDSPTGTPFHDKEMITCDVNPGSPYQGFLYVTWTLFGADWTNPIYLSRSTDGGETWSAPVRVSQESSCQWSNPAVGPDGTLYVAWFSFDDWALKIRRSTNGGVNFGSEFTIQPIHHGWGEIQGGIDVISYPAIDVDRSPGPFQGTIYVAYADSGENGNLDILFTKCTDQLGMVWTPPIRINDDPPTSNADQFHPWLKVDENGGIHVIFYDRRNDPNNYAFDLYITHSYDGGQTWTPNERITWVSSEPIGRAGLIGEYIGLSVRHGRTLAVWTDTRNGNQDVFAGLPDSLVVVQEPSPPLAQQPSVRVLTPVFRHALVVSSPRPVPLVVYNTVGRRVWQGVLPAGVHTLPTGSWPAGVYLLQNHRVVRVP